MANPQRDVGIDLNEQVPVHDIDLNDPLPVHAHVAEDVVERRNTVEVYLPNPSDWDDVPEDLFQFNNTEFWEANGEGDEQHEPHEADVPDEADRFAEVVELSALNQNGDPNGVQLPDLNEPAVGDRQKRKQYSDATKRSVYAMLLEGSQGGRLLVGLSLQVSLAMEVSLRCVQRIWYEGQRGGGIHAIENKRAKNCGRKKFKLPPESIAAIPFKDRTTLEDLARSLGMAKTTIFSRLKEGAVERHSNAIKPYLTDENKRSRVQYCLDMLEPHTVPHQPVFKSMYNVVPMDEKWFHRTKTTQKVYCAPGEERPRRTCKSKNYIDKVMFLAGQARPRFNAQRECIWDGKIGLYPFVFIEPAKRKSLNRPRGTMVTKQMTSVTRDVIRRFVIDKLLPDIKAKWPAEDRNSIIWIQQDNCRTHIPVDDPEFCAAAQADGWDIRLMCQPANSLDCNVLDLGFFAAIQSLFRRSGMPINIDDIIHKVVTAYQNYPVARSNKIFLTHMSCLVEILKDKGGQHYDIPHMKKDVLERLGTLPITLPCDSAIVQQAIEFLG